jgi:hypothetical protein
MRLAIGSILLLAALAAIGYLAWLALAGARNRPGERPRKSVVGLLAALLFLVGIVVVPATETSSEDPPRANTTRKPTPAPTSSGPEAGTQPGKTTTVPSPTSKRSPPRDEPSDNAERAARVGVRLSVVDSKSYCQQDPLVGNVDVVVALRNSGDVAARNVSILPIRQYATGREVRPIGDTMVDIEVPADGKRHASFASYGVGDGELIVGCQVKIVADGVDDRERTIGVRAGG